MTALVRPKSDVAWKSASIKEDFELVDFLASVSYSTKNDPYRMRNIRLRFDEVDSRRSLYRCMSKQ